MSPLWQTICFTALLIHSVHSDAIDSNTSKSDDRDHSSRSHSPYESNGYPSQSLINTNGQNGPQQSLAVSESNTAPHYSGHQTNDQIDQNKNERKTLILAIPVKLSMPKADQDSYEQLRSQSSELSQSQSQVPSFYSSAPYVSSVGLSQSEPSLAEPESLDSDESDSSAPKSATLPPLSHKIYSSLESQLKSSPYSTVNSHKSVSEQSVPSSLSYNSNDRKYKTSYDLKDQKSIGSQYGRDANTYRGNPRQEYKGLSNDGNGNDYGLKQVVNKAIGPLADKYEDSYDTRLKQKNVGKQVFESAADNKPDYEYEDEEEEDDKKVEDEYIGGLYKGIQSDKNVYHPKNLKKNVNNQKNYGNYGLTPALIASLLQNGKAITGQSQPMYLNEPYDSWPQFYYPKPNAVPRLPEPIDTNLLSLLNGYQNPIKDNVRNNLYAPAFDLLADSQLKAASNPSVLKTMENSKIYGPAAKYQSSYPMINLLAGYGQNYGLVDVNGELYPAPLVAQPPPRNQVQSQQPIQQNEQNSDHNSPNRDSIKPHRRNPLLLRPSFMSGLRPSANKPSASKGPFGSASTTHSLLSSLPSLPSLVSLPTSFSLNAKSIPRQIFPYFYG